MRRAWIGITCAAWVGTWLAPHQAHADCADGAVTGAFHARVSETQVGALLRDAVQQLPTELEVPPSPVEVFGCPGFLDDTVVTPRNARVGLEVQETSVALEAGIIDLRIVLNLDVDADLDLELCALPDASCATAIDGEAIEITSRLEFEVDACSPAVAVESIVVGVTPDNTDVNVQSCGLYDEVINAVYGWFEKPLLEMIQTRVGDAVAELAPSFAEEAFAAVASSGVEAMGLSIQVSPESVRVTDDAVFFQLGAAIEALNPPESCAPVGEAEPLPPADAPVPFADGGVALTVTKHFADYLLDVAWRQGWLCIDTRDLGLEIDDALGELASGVEISAVVQTPQRPSLQWSEHGAGGILGVDLPELEVQLSFEVPNESPSVITVASKAFVEATLEMDPVDSAILMRPTAVHADRLDLDTRSGPIELDPVGLQNTVDELLMPMFEDEMEPMTLTGGVFAASGFVASLVGMETSSTGVSIGLNLYAAVGGDETPPETRLESPPPAITSANTTVTMASVDESPPERQLRHRVTIDGVREEELRTGRHLAFTSLARGKHEIKIAAVDVSGNEDPTPVRVTLDVDALAPKITLIDPPLGFVRDEVVTVEVEVEDDRTARNAVQVNYSVGEVSRERNSRDL
ncbi:MAG: hypothetical protein AAF658_06095, partial [Myxococcota bacterium]